MACAAELADAGRAVVLYEAARQLGGRARGLDWNGIRIDNGQHVLIGAYRATLSLLRRLGTEQRLERHPLRLSTPTFRLALPHLPAPLHVAIGLLAARGLSWADKLAAARFMQALQGDGYRLDEDVPVAHLLRRHAQSATLVERLWAPICIAALNTPVAQASAQVFCNVLRDSLGAGRSASDFLVNRGDLSQLLGDALQARLGEQVRLETKVTGIRRSGTGFHLEGPGKDAEQVVLAIHPARVPALAAQLPELAGTARAMADYTWQPILTLWLRFAAPLPFPYPLIALGDGHAPWAFERNDLAPGLVSIVMSAEGPHLELPPQRLRHDYLELLAAAVGPLPGLLDWKIITEKRATWSCVPGMFRPDNTTPVPGMYLAGDYTAGDYPATLEGAVRSGVKCASLILAPRQIQHSTFKTQNCRHDLLPRP